MKIALFGGTFDPIHFGHLIIAEEVRQRFSLDQVYFIPSAQPPHKPAPKITSPSDRFLMATIATLSNPHFFVSPVEIDRGGTSYSIETIEYFQERFGPQIKLYFMMGVDTFLEISTWKNYQQLLASCQLIITTRPGFDFQSTIENLPTILLNHHHGLTSSIHKMGHPGPQVIQDKGENLFFVYVPDINISSTVIQRRALEAKSLRYLVPLGVEQFIKKYGLYSKGV